MMGWKQHAECSGWTELDWFAEHVSDEIVDVCLVCPVRPSCLMQALDGDPEKELGIRAATTEQDRRDIRAGRREPWEIWDAQKQRTLQLT
jgi:hypothetical protein